MAVFANSISLKNTTELSDAAFRAALAPGMPYGLVPGEIAVRRFSGGFEFYGLDSSNAVVTIAPSLELLSDTDFDPSLLSGGEALIWNASSQRWVATPALTPSLGGNSIDELLDVDTSTTPPTEGQVLGWTGSIWAPTSGATDLPIGSFADVDLTYGPSQGDALIWDPSIGKWVAGSPASNLENITDVSFSVAPAAGDVLYYDGTNWNTGNPASGTLGVTNLDGVSFPTGNLGDIGVDPSGNLYWVNEDGTNNWSQAAVSTEFSIGDLYDVDISNANFADGLVVQRDPVNGEQILRAKPIATKPFDQTQSDTETLNPGNFPPGSPVIPYSGLSFSKKFSLAGLGASGNTKITQATIPFQGVFRMAGTAVSNGVGIVTDDTAEGRLDNSDVDAGTCIASNNYNLFPSGCYYFPADLVDGYIAPQENFSNIADLINPGNDYFQFWMWIKISDANQSGTLFDFGWCKLRINNGGAIFEWKEQGDASFRVVTLTNHNITSNNWTLVSVQKYEAHLPYGDDGFQWQSVFTFKFDHGCQLGSDQQTVDFRTSTPVDLGGTESEIIYNVEATPVGTSEADSYPRFGEDGFNGWMGGINFGVVGNFWPTEDVFPGNVFRDPEGYSKPVMLYDSFVPYDNFTQGSQQAGGSLFVALGEVDDASPESNLQAVGNATRVTDLTDVDFSTFDTVNKYISWNPTTQKWEGTPAPDVTNVSIGTANDVDLTGLSNGNTLQYNSASGNFEPASFNSTAATIDEFNDVDISTNPPTSNQTLQWNGTDWVPVDMPGLTISSLDDLDDVNLTTFPPTNGQLLGYVGGEWAAVNAPVAGATTLSELTDVDLTTTPPTNDQALVYDGSEWIPQTLTQPAAPTVLGDLTNVDETGKSVNDALIWNGTNWVPGPPTPIKNLNNINDVNVPSPSNGQTLQWNGAAWVAGSLVFGGASSLAELTDTDTTTLHEGEALLYTGTVWKSRTLGGRGDGGDFDTTKVGSGFIAGVYGGGDWDTTTPDLPSELLDSIADGGDFD